MHAVYIFTLETCLADGGVVGGLLDVRESHPTKRRRGEREARTRSRYVDEPLFAGLAGNVLAPPPYRDVARPPHPPTRNLDAPGRDRW